MLTILKPRNIEELIISLLQKGEADSVFLLQKVREGRPRTTKQGFYLALRKLRANDIVVTYRSKVALNVPWVTEMSKLFDGIERSYTKERSTNLFDLADKESVSYTFATIKALDTFWGHAQSLVVRNTQADEPVYTYDPHYWFYVARKETEKRLLDDIVRSKRQFLITVVGQTPIDKLIGKEFNTDYLQCHFEKVFVQPNYYLTVIGDYITEAFLDKKIQQEVDRLFQTETTLNDKLVSDLYKLLNSKGKSRIKISRNKKKAEQLKKMFRKYFYILKPKNEAGED